MAICNFHLFVRSVNESLLILFTFSCFLWGLPVMVASLLGLGYDATMLPCWLRGPAVEHWSLADVLSLSCARLVADG